MNHKEVIETYLKIPSTQQWDSAFDYLNEDFVFKTPLRKIKGRLNYINFEKDRVIPILETPLLMFANDDESVFYHINILEFPTRSNSSLIIHQEITIAENQITSITITGKELSDEIIEEHYPEYMQKVKQIQS